MTVRDPFAKQVALLVRPSRSSTGTKMSLPSRVAQPSFLPQLATPVG